LDRAGYLLSRTAEVAITNAHASGVVEEPHAIFAVLVVLVGGGEDPSWQVKGSQDIC